LRVVRGGRQMVSDGVVLAGGASIDAIRAVCGRAVSAGAAAGVLVGRVALGCWSGAGD
jgi:hypothetical protein